MPARASKRLKFFVPPSVSDPPPPATQGKEGIAWSARLFQEMEAGEAEIGAQNLGGSVRRETRCGDGSGAGGKEGASDESAEMTTCLLALQVCFASL